MAVEINSMSRTKTLFIAICVFLIGLSVIIGIKKYLQNPQAPKAGVQEIEPGVSP